MLGIGNGYSRTRVSGRGADGVLSFDASTNSASLAEDGDDLSDGVRAEYSGYSRWFPVGGREAGFAPVDLDEMLSSGYGECAPFTQSVDGSVCLVVRTDPNAPIHPLVLWLDPERGMFPRLQRTYDAGGVISEWYVTDFFEVADGTWLPAAGRFWCRGLAQNTDEFRFPFERVMTVVPKANGEPGAWLESEAGDPLAVPAGTLMEDAATGATWFAARSDYADSARWALAVIRGEDLRRLAESSTWWRSGGPGSVVLIATATALLGSFAGFRRARSRINRAGI